MSPQAASAAKTPAAGPPVRTPARSGLLQRRCACGGMAGPTGECAACRRKGLAGGATFQAKLRMNRPGDPFEREADRVAEQVMRMPGLVLQRQEDEEEEEEFLQAKPLIQRRVSGEAGGGAAPPIVHDVLRSPGRPLDSSTRRFMEARLGHDFSQVRIHADGQAAASAQAVNARAFTVGRDVVFGPGEYAPGSWEGQRLLAHELVHVVQQGERSTHLQRVIEIRPPGRGEASAFDRRQELIDRLNAQSPAIQYWLEGRRLRYRIVDESALTNFDRQMRSFIDRPEVVPMRLITRSGYVGGGPLLVDSLVLAYVDLDDLLASRDLSFQLNLIHLLTERFGVRRYAQRIGTAMPEFNRVHRAGLEAEAAHLRSVIGDPSIRFNYEEERPNGTVVFAFRSSEGYRVFHVFRGAGREERHGVIWVQTRDGRRLTVEQLRQERAGRVEEREEAFHLQWPGLGSSPFPRLRLAPELDLRLDPEIQAQINAMRMMQELLDPDRIRSSLFRIDFGALLATQPPPWLTGPPTPTPAPLVPPGAGPSTPRTATAGDLLKAVLGIPAVNTALTRLRSQAEERVRRDWRRLSTGERVLLVSHTALLTGTALAGVLANPEARQFTLGLIQNRAIPVPGVPGLTFQFNLTGPNRLIRFDLNLGALLPPSWGFR